MAPDTLLVSRGEFTAEDPWAIPRQCDLIRLRRASDSAPPRLSTTVAAYYDDEYLNIVYSAADDHICATYTGHDEPLYEEDVVEVFLAPDGPGSYFEIEVNPLGATFDARIDSPAGVREGMQADLAWTCEGLVAAVRKTIEQGRSITVDTLMRIPFAALGGTAPGEGVRWRANFFRIDRHPQEGDEYSAWRPTLKTPADFHVVAAFGTLAFGR